MSEQKTILIIDDEPSNIQVIINLLQNSLPLYKVMSSSNSSLGLEIAIQTKPNIIITDWEMPNLNGIELITELKANIQTKDIPIIMATGVNISSANLKLALDSGAYDFIRKPIDEMELVARINSALRFVEYYSAKIENERLILKIREDNHFLEIESKKRELLSKTMILLKINRLHESFQEKMEAIQCDKHKPDCEVYCFSQIHTNEIIKSGNEQIWNELEHHFEQINDSFYKNITHQFPNLTPNERKLCAYLRLNLSTKDISSITSQSLRSIEIARTRLREKLNLKGADEDLHSFLIKF